MSKPWNREVMPRTAEFVDAIQAEFGQGARLVYAAEGGYEVGTEVITENVGLTAGGAAMVSEETERRHIGPVATPATRRDDPTSSEQAEREVTRSGRRAAQQVQCAEAVRAHPGMTSSELSRLCGLDRHMLGRRLPEIEAGEGPGDVLRAGQRRDPQTGRSGLRWWPIEVAVRHMAERIRQEGPRKLYEYQRDYGAWVAQQVESLAIEKEA